MHNCDLVNLEDMLQNGTVITGTLIERPHSFSTACNIATQIIAQVASNQYGGQSISLTHLAPFVDVSAVRRSASMVEAGDGRDRRCSPAEEAVTRLVENRLRDEIRRGVQTIQYQVVTLLTTNGQAPFVTVFMYLDEARNEQEKRGPGPDHRGDAGAALPGREERGRRLGHPGLPQAHLRTGGGQHPRGFPLLVSHQAGRQVHRPADGAGLYLRKEDAGAQGRRVHLHGLPLLPDPGPLHRRGHRQYRQRRQLRARQAQVLRPVQPGRGHHQPAGCGPFLRRGPGEVLADL